MRSSSRLGAPRRPRSATLSGKAGSSCICRYWRSSAAATGTAPMARAVSSMAQSIAAKRTLAARAERSAGAAKRAPANPRTVRRLTVMREPASGTGASPLGVHPEQSLPAFAVTADIDALASSNIILVEQIGHVEIDAPIIFFIADFQIGECHGGYLERVLLVGVGRTDITHAAAQRHAFQCTFGHRILDEDRSLLLRQEIRTLADKGLVRGVFLDLQVIGGDTRRDLPVFGNIGLHLKFEAARIDLAELFTGKAGAGQRVFLGQVEKGRGDQAIEECRTIFDARFILNAGFRLG